VFLRDWWFLYNWSIFNLHTQQANTFYCRVHSVTGFVTGGLVTLTGATLATGGAPGGVCSVGRGCTTPPTGITGAAIGGGAEYGVFYA